jgi:glycosyltransferase involved in cell wall biosynthesis
MEEQRSREVLVVLPAYNEEENIGELLSQIRYALEEDSKINYKVFVVNDGSRDKTQAIAEEMAKTMPIEVLVHDVT